MKELYPSLSMEILSGLFGLTRQGYYKQNRGKTADVLREEVILELVAEVRKKIHRCGGRVLLGKIKEGLEAHQIHMEEMPFLICLPEMAYLSKPESVRYTQQIPIIGLGNILIFL